MSATASSSIPVLFFWSQSLMQWRPLFIAESDLGRSVFAALRDQLASHLLNVCTADVPSCEATDDALEHVAELLPSSMAPFPADASARFRVSSSAESSAVPVLYVWPPCGGSWVPLVIAVSAVGRRVARELGEHLAELGVNGWLVGQPADDPAAIDATARDLRPPAGVDFIDPAPDGVIDHSWIGFAGPSH